MTPATDQERLERVRHWLERVRSLSDANHPLGRTARDELPVLTGLAPASVEWGLTQAFEVDANDAELAALVASVTPAPAAHVLLSANVFTSALRAIALALASSVSVSVRPSRREPLTATLLQSAAPDAFAIAARLRPNPGDHVWAYGADETLSELRTQLPAGVVLHGHGSGFGVLLVDAPERLTERDFDAMALDVAAFDQRGCLSPHHVLLEGRLEQGREFVRDLSAAMTRMAITLPVGVTEPAVRAAVARHREIWHYLGEVLQGPGGMITLDGEGHPWGTAPGARTIHVKVTRDALAELVGLSGAVTAVGSRHEPALARRIQQACPTVRWSPYGFMQRPRLDGPADRRTPPAGIVL